MDHLKEYYRIIDYRILNKLCKGLNTELHHITPRKFFDKTTPLEIIDREENLVYLTQEEHFLVHYHLKEYYKELKESNHIDYNKYYYKISLKGFDAMGLKDTNFKNVDSNAKLYEQGKQDLLEYYKQENINTIHEICKFRINHNRNPKQKVSEENSLYNILYRLKKFKKDGEYLFYNEYQEIADGYGLNDLFDYIDNEEIALNRIGEICEFKKETGINPRMNSRNIQKDISEYEHKLGVLLSKFKLIKKHGSYNRQKWLDSYQDLIDKYGYSELFESDSIEDQILNKLNKICDYIDEYGYTIPTKNNNGSEERSLALTLQNIRKNHKKGKDLFKSYYDLIEDRGYSDLFESRKYSKRRNSKIKKE